MRKLLLSCMILLSAGMSAQGIKFGKHYMERSQNARKAVVASEEKAGMRTQRKGGVMLDEASEIQGDYCFRFVYAYNKDKERSSETIYMREKIDGKWSDEKLYDVGRYTYEYDSDGRVTVKDVVYDDGTGWFANYRVMVEYGDGVTSYTKYENYNDGEGYQIVEGWSYYDNGQMASHTYYETKTGHIEQEMRFTPEGYISGIQKDMYKHTYTGSVNDSTIVSYNSEYSEDKGYYFTDPCMTEHYKYDSTGKLLEYCRYEMNGYESYEDDCKYVYSYDSLGRIAKITKYNLGDENSGVVASRAAGEPEWVEDYTETYTYFNDDVYGIGNSWHDVFDFDGPLTSMIVKGSDYSSEMKATRDVSGKITAISFKEESSYGSSPVHEFTIDAAGHITKYTSVTTNDWDPDYRNEFVHDYTWSGENLVRGEYLDKTTDKDGSYESSWTDDYSYGPNSFTIIETNHYGTSKTYMEQKGNRFYAYLDDSENALREDRWVNIREVQTEDVKFVRPNVMKDYDGFSTDSTIIVSVAGRVVCLNANDINYDGGYGFTMGIDNKDMFSNIVPEAYFSVSHDGDKTVCKDMEDRPVYILEGDRLIKEYIYFEPSYEVQPGEPNEVKGSAANTAARSETDPQTLYEEVTYHYADNGLPTGRTVVAVDENGSRTEEISIEYKYDPTSGINAPEFSATQGASLNGRTLGIADGGVFCVYDVQGRLLAANTTSYTFATAGVYVITVNGNSFKMSVK